MKAKEIKEKLLSQSEAELIKDLNDAYKHLGDLRFDLATKKVKNYKEIRETKRKIARLLTILKEREISSQGSSQRGVKNA